MARNLEFAENAIEALILNNMAKTLSLSEKYQKEIKPVLISEFAIKNVMAVPNVTKIVINAGTGDLYKTKEAYQKFTADFAAITGQKPKVQPARISVAGFNLRAGTPVGLSVTLRGRKMYDFLEKLISVVLPRLRDFRGVSLKSFDNVGNYTIGMHEHTVFPEIDLAKVDKPRSLEVTIVSNTKNKELSKRLLELLGMPFEKGQEGKTVKR